MGVILMTDLGLNLKLSIIHTASADRSRLCRDKNYQLSTINSLNYHNLRRNFRRKKNLFTKNARIHDALTISASHFQNRLFRLAKKQIFGAKCHKRRRFGIAIYIEALLKDTHIKNMKLPTWTHQHEITNMKLLTWNMKLSTNLFLLSNV